MRSRWRWRRSTGCRPWRAPLQPGLGPADRRVHRHPLPARAARPAPAARHLRLLRRGGAAPRADGGRPDARSAARCCSGWPPDEHPRPWSARLGAPQPAGRRGVRALLPGGAPAPASDHGRGLGYRAADLVRAVPAAAVRVRVVRRGGRARERAGGGGVADGPSPAGRHRWPAAVVGLLGADQPAGHLLDLSGRRQPRHRRGAGRHRDGGRAAPLRAERLRRLLPGLGGRGRRPDHPAGLGQSRRGVPGGQRRAGAARHHRGAGVPRAWRRSRPPTRRPRWCCTSSTSPAGRPRPTACRWRSGRPGRSGWWRSLSRRASIRSGSGSARRRSDWRRWASAASRWRCCC